MQISISQQSFSQSIRKISRVIKNTVATPILAGILLKATPSGLEIVGDNNDYAIKANLTNNRHNHLVIDQPGSIVVNARLFKQIISNMPKTDLTVTANAKYQVEITGGQAKFTINALDASNYPHLKGLSTPSPMVMSSPDLANILKKTVFATSNDSSRPILEGVNFFTDHSGQLIAQATDAHRLNRLATGVKTSQNIDVTVLGQSLKDLMPLLSNSQKVSIAFSRNQAQFRVDNRVTMLSQLIQGRYPSTEDLIPSKFNTVVTVKSDRLLDALNRANIVADAKPKASSNIELNIKNGSVTIASNVPDLGEDSEPVSANVSGEPLTIYANPSFMIDAIKAIGPKSTAVIKLIAPLKPFLIESQADTQKTFLQLVTPIRKL